MKDAEAKVGNYKPLYGERKPLYNDCKPLYYGLSEKGIKPEPA